MQCIKKQGSYSTINFSCKIWIYGFPDDSETIMSKEVIQQATEGANIRCLGYLKAGLNYNT